MPALLLAAEEPALEAWVPAAIPVLGLALCVLAQVAAFRLRPRGGLLRSLAAGFACGLAGAGALTALCWEAHGGSTLDRVATGLANLLVYAALGYGYFHFVNLGETARRIRLLRELREAGPLEEAELLRRYGARAIVEVRLGRLARKGQVVLVDGRWRLGRPHLLLPARVLRGLKRLLLGRSREAAP